MMGNILTGGILMNKKTRTLTQEEFDLIITTIKQGFTYKGIVCRPNIRIATALTLQANLGLRIGDVLNFRMNMIIRDGNRYRLDMSEEKTNKKRLFTVPLQIYNYIKIYCLENNIKDSAKIFEISERAIQKHLKTTCDYLGLDGISTHSFRKFFATEIYLNNDYDIVLVQKLLQHSNVSITQKYIGSSEEKVENALENHIHIV